MNFKYVFLFFTSILISCGEKTKEKVASKQDNNYPLHIVFVTGEEEYRSEESFPMLAKLAKRELGAKVTVVYSLDSLGFIDPNRTDHISGLEEFNEEWPAKVFGQQWITHHGHFDDGKFPVTDISIIESQSENPILNGFEKFEAYSWLYHVDGGDWKLQGDSKPLLMGHSTKSQHEIDGDLDKFSLDNPVAWTKSYTGTSGDKARVFFTTLGHPYDFKIPVVRKIAMNGIYWALGKEGEIPEDGVKVTLDEPFLPNNSGFGQKFKKNQKPTPIK